MHTKDKLEALTEAGARSPACHARGCRRLHHEAAEGRAGSRGMADGDRLLIGAAEGRDFLMHSRIGMLRALNRNTERVFNPDRKDTHWAKRKLARDR